MALQKEEQAKVEKEETELLKELKTVTAMRSTSVSGDVPPRVAVPKAKQ